MSTPDELRRRLIRNHLNTERQRYGVSGISALTNEQTRAILEEAITVMMHLHQDFEIGIVTALPKEFAAAVAMIDEARRYDIKGDPNLYYRGVIRDSAGQILHHVVVTTCAKMGNNSAAATTTNLIRSFSSIKDVLMVGIAGGMPNPKRPEDHVRLGDVVVSHGRGIVQYDMLKVSEERVELRDVTSPPSARMIRAVNLLEADRIAGSVPWEQHINRGTHLEGAARPDDVTDVLYDPTDPAVAIPHPECPTRRNGMPRVHYGLVGSANILLKEPKFRDELRDRFGIRAIEMEGSGVADGTWLDGAGYLVIRGVCDYCDGHKNDLWQGYAAVAAAAYARALLETLPATFRP